jgi:hypothetical protein
MKKVTLKFDSLSELSECMYQLGVTRPLLDYAKYTMTAILNEDQIEHAISCKAQIVLKEDQTTLD